MRKSKEATKETTTQIIKTALQIFSKKGYESTNLQDIADELGITRTPIYYHFRNKLILFERTTKDYLNEKRNVYVDIFTSDESIFDKVRSDLMQCAQRGIMEITLFMGLDALPELEKVRKDKDETYRFIYDTKIQAVKQAISQGELRPDTDPGDFVNNCYVLFHGIVGMVKEPFFHNLSKDDIMKLIDTSIQGMMVKYKNT